MEVKPGYKQTEVGVVPEEWSIRPLGLICDVRDGTHESPRFFTDGIPFVTSKNIVDGRLDLENVNFISKSDAVEFDKRSKVDRNDILLSMIGTIGSAVLVDCEPNFCIKNVALIKPRKVAPTYLIRLINAPVFQRYLTDNLDGGIQKFISLGTLRQLSIPLPEEAEQRAIATALSDVDGLLGGLDRLIAKKRDLKQAAMQQLLTGQTRLPGFHGEWEVKRLGDVCRITTGKKDVNEGNPNGQFPFFTCSRTHTFSDSYSFDTEAILIAGNGEVGNLHYINGKFEAYQRTYVLSAFSANVGYLWQQLSAFLAESLGLGKIGSSIPYIKKENLVGFEFDSPRDLAEQTAIAEVLTEMDAELAALEQRREKTRALKQAMMQELLTGKTRLVAPDAGMRTEVKP
jgi:type I restriction enzyme, S subunit